MIPIFQDRVGEAIAQGCTNLSINALLLLTLSSSRRDALGYLGKNLTRNLKIRHTFVKRQQLELFMHQYSCFITATFLSGMFRGHNCDRPWSYLLRLNQCTIKVQGKS
jgi:hypothetical protein